MKLVAILQYEKSCIDARLYDIVSDKSGDGEKTKEIKDIGFEWLFHEVGIYVVYMALSNVSGN